MKLLLILLCIISATPLSLDAADPSKEETITWLKRKLTKLQTVYEVGPTFVSTTIEEFSVNKGVMTLAIKKTQIVESSEVVSEQRYSVALSELSTKVRVDTWEVNSTPRCYMIGMEVTKGDGVSWLVVRTGKTAKLKGMNIVVSDEELAKRVVKALSSLIRAFGGADEPF